MAHLGGYLGAHYLEPLLPQTRNLITDIPPPLDRSWTLPPHFAPFPREITAKYAEAGNPKAMALSIRQFLYLARFNPYVSFSSTSLVSPLPSCHSHLSFSLRNRNQTAIASPVVKASAGNGSPAKDDDDGVSLGTMVLPPDTDLKRFESLLFQWANSLCQGANLPLPVPLKVDKIAGGARLGFITVEDGKTEVLVYIDCLVFPATNDSVPMFRAVRNGLLKDKEPPGEPRIMRSLLQALKKSVEIARL